MIQQRLDSGWTFEAAADSEQVPAQVRGRRVPARVPGCVHTDLMRAGLLEDPYLGLNEAKQFWIGETDWRYACTFDAQDGVLDHERVDLVFDGLDTVATVELNGQRIGESMNMHHPHRFDVKRVIKAKGNSLVVTFRSPNQYAREWEQKLGKLPYLNTPVPFNFIRKMACSFGWDWGPTTATSGIWQGVRVEGWSGFRIKSVRPQILGAGVQTAVIDVHLEYERASKTDHIIASVELALDGRVVATGDEATAGNRDVITFTVNNPALWWPQGYGAQPLYELRVEAGGETWSGRIGLRTVELDTSPDEVGSAFTLKVNGKPIFCRGFNWIPDDCFLDRACEPGRYRQRIQQALDANANMLRVWGGGIYETDTFYDLCDEMGMLVWQDMLFACAAYPEEEPFRSSVEQEVRHNVARLSRHPSLVLWNGCNENLWGYHDWGWKREKRVPAGRTWGPGYYLDLLPKLVEEVDPSRPYWAASPWSGDPDWENGLYPNLSNHGNKHVWEAWFGDHYYAYRQFTPRFCSEFGFQGPATYAGIAGAIGAGETNDRVLDFTSVQLRHRQKSTGIADDGDRRNLRHLARTFQLPNLDRLQALLQHPQEGRERPWAVPVELYAPGTPSGVDFDDLHYLLQLNQARALTLGVEWFRSRQPVCMGTLYWQLNDAWPGATSWSAIDGDGRPKPLWYATRRFYAPRLLSIQPRQDMLELCVINDSDEAWVDTCTFALLDMPSGERARVRGDLRFEVPARSVVRYPLDGAPIVRPLEPQRQVLVAQAGEQRTTWYYAPDKQLAYPKPAMEFAVRQEGAVQMLAIRAQSFVRDLCIFVDRLDPSAMISEQLLTLLPGEQATVEVRLERKLRVEDLKVPIVQCANRFGAAG